MYNKAVYEHCLECGEAMHGIFASKEPIRKVCEPCGGNSTEFSADNPAPVLRPRLKVKKKAS